MCEMEEQLGVQQIPLATQWLVQWLHTAHAGWPVASPRLLCNAPTSES